MGRDAGLLAHPRFRAIRCNQQRRRHIAIAQRHRDARALLLERRHRGRAQLDPLCARLCGERRVERRVLDHGVGGITGALLTGVFAVEAYGGTAGLLEGNAAQLLNQVYGVVIVIVYDAIVSLILLKVIDMVIGLRVTKEVEQEGLDLALHGEVVQ